MASIVFTLNTTKQVPEALQDRVWKELVKVAAENSTNFRFGHPTNPTLVETLKRLGRIENGTSITKAIDGELSPAVVDWLLSNNLREKLDWIEFYNGSERCLAHYDEGQQVSVVLNSDAALKLKKGLQAEGIDPDLTLFISTPEISQ